MIETREDLIHLLSEAAEMEHNLLCSYLYATFSLKRAGEDRLSDEQGRAVEGWRKLVLSIALEEMAHLACVNNLLLAIGGAAHFDRPNLPVSPGYHPSGIVVRLASFTLDTLDHFIFLERPKSDNGRDGQGFEETATARTESDGRLTPSAIDYDTVGDLYDAVSAGLTTLAASLGETQLFSHGVRGQIDARQTGLPSVGTASNLQSALEIVELIKEQGEGSSGSREDSHFDRFLAIKQEWASLSDRDADFVPAWPAAQDPVMRRPLNTHKRVWICEGQAARYLDCANAIYGLMLIILQQAYSLEYRPAQTPLLKLAVALMELVAVFGNALARMSAGSGYPGVNGGMTFAVPRNLGYRVGSLGSQLSERLEYLAAGILRAVGTEKEIEQVTARIAQCRQILSTISD